MELPNQPSNLEPHARVVAVAVAALAGIARRLRAINRRDDVVVAVWTARSRAVCGAECVAKDARPIRPNTRPVALSGVVARDWVGCEGVAGKGDPVGSCPDFKASPPSELGFATNAAEAGVATLWAARQQPITGAKTAAQRASVARPNARPSREPGVVASCFIRRGTTSSPQILPCAQGCSCCRIPSNAAIRPKVWIAICNGIARWRCTSKAVNGIWCHMLAQLCASRAAAQRGVDGPRGLDGAPTAHSDESNKADATRQIHTARARGRSRARFAPFDLCPVAPLRKQPWPTKRCRKGRRRPSASSS